MDHSRPLVSVVIPSYNYERFLEDAIRSVWAQTWRPLELIVSDDGSSDQSVALARRLQAESPVPMTVLELEHGGVIASLNRSIGECRGHYVAFLAADDRFLPQKLEVQMGPMLEDPKVVLSHCSFRYIDAEGELLPIGVRQDRPAARGDALVDLLLGRATMLTGPVARRDVLTQFGGFDPRFPQEDWPLYLKSAAAGRLAFESEPLVERRIHGKNWSAAPRLHASLDQVLNDAAIELLRELAPSCDVFERAIVHHASLHVRVALSHGHFVWGARMAGRMARRFPSQRWAVARNVTPGLLGFFWSHGLRRFVPLSARAQVVSWAKSVLS